jgi:hypothetical protein
MSLLSSTFRKEVKRMQTDIIPIEGPCICGSTTIDLARDGDGSLYVCGACRRYYVYWSDDQLRLTLHPKRVTGIVPGWQLWLREKVADLLR